MPRMYSDLAHLWPVISPPEGYALEALLWKRTLRELLGDGRPRVLELGVGGGHNLSHLTDAVEATAVDLSPRMLDLSRRLNPGVEHHVGDMRTVRLGRTFDAVLVHDAVAYMQTPADLRALFATAAVHLRPGGAFLATPDHVRETFVDPTTRVKTARFDGERELTFFEYAHDPDPGDTTYETLYLYLLRQGGGRPERILDVHTHGLFPLATWLELMAGAGFSAEARRHDLEGPTHEGFMMVGVRH